VWQEKQDLLRSVPSIGKVILLTLLIDLPWLGTLCGKKIAP
jgi:hypothetical protein